MKKYNGKQDDPYVDYFKNHYNYSFTNNDVNTYVQWFRTQWNFIKAHIKIKQKDKILEVGCGVGGFYYLLQEDGYKNYSGIELDAQAVKFANSYFKSKNFRHIAVEKMKVAARYDKVFSFEVLEHVDNPTDVIKRIHSFLKKDGIFCGTSPFPYAKNVYADKTHKYVLHPKNWEKLFLEQGFKSVRLYPMSFVPYIWRFFPNLNIRLPFYIPLQYFVSTTLIIATK